MTFALSVTVIGKMQTLSWSKFFAFLPSQTDAYMTFLDSTAAIAFILSVSSHTGIVTPFSAIHVATAG